MISETRSCGASIVIDYTAITTRDADNTGYRNVAEENAVATWRAMHQHQVATRFTAEGVEPGLRPHGAHS
ncbi:hypothetical protein [Cellulomonas rhizosphaerae]|uniref:Uncharacterized protein n=1 Tax=Cellulomonas rhizosphaerae TaxID=2293719 RepID=A0A413RJL5_9CELL|nr:hypothetical protein [Cellulomonas rhizosphaerae]RHA38714.1 hypothetical protein D1825_13350 [Cellulomonas rhizosphaerae]